MHMGAEETWTNEKRGKDKTGVLLFWQNLWVGFPTNGADLEVLPKQNHSVFSFFALLSVFQVLFQDNGPWVVAANIH